jgi:hypothetical protein
MRAIPISLFLTVIVASPAAHAEPIAAPFCPQSKQGINKLSLTMDKLNDVFRDVSAVKNDNNLHFALGTFTISLILNHSITEVSGLIEGYRL